jgi:WD40 repeat protein
MHLTGLIFLWCTAAVSADVPRSDDQRLRSGAIARFGSVKFLHRESVRALAFFPDGKTIVSSAQEPFLRVWDISTGREVRRLVSDGSRITEFALSPDGAMMAAVDNGRGFHVWDTATGKRLHKRADEKTAFRTVAWFSDGLVVSTDGSIRRIDTSTFAATAQQLASKSMRSLAFDSAGRILLCTDADNIVRVWDVSGGKERHRLEGLLDSHTSVAVSKNGSHGAATCMTPTGPKSYRSSVRLWNLETGKTLHELPIYSVAALSFSPDGRFLVSGHHGGEIRFWDVATGKKSREWHGRDTRVWCLAWAPAGAVLASGGESQRVRFWDPATGKEIEASPGHAGIVQSVAFAPDGATIASAGVDRTLRFWDWAKAKELRRRDDVGDHWGLEGLAYTADGKALLSMAKGLPAAVFRQWDPATGAPSKTFGAKKVYVSTYALMPDSETLAAACHDGTVAIWELTTGKLIRKVGKHKEGLVGLAVAPDGKTFAWASGFQTLGLWDAETGQELRRFQGSHHHNNCFMAFSPDGSLLATANTGSSTEPVHLWDVATGRSLARWPHAGGAQAVAFAPNGLALAAGGHEGVVVWDIPTRQQLVRFEAHLGVVKSIAWSPDSTLLVSGAADGTLLVWDTTGQLREGRLLPLALNEEEMNRLWQGLLSADPREAHDATWKLAACSDSASFLAKRLRPIGPLDAERLKKLLVDLDADDFVVRERATQQLAGLGQTAAPALRKEAGTKDAGPEPRLRVHLLLKKLESAAAVAESRRSVRAVAILEANNSAESRRLLNALAGGAPEAGLTKAAGAARTRLEQAKHR